MNVLVVVLLVLALVLTGLAAFGIGRPRLHLGWMGVAAAIVAYLLSNLHV